MIRSICLLPLTLKLAGLFVNIFMLWIGGVFRHLPFEKKALDMSCVDSQPFLRFFHYECALAINLSISNPSFQDPRVISTTYRKCTDRVTHWECCWCHWSDSRFDYGSEQHSLAIMKSEYLLSRLLAIYQENTMIHLILYGPWPGVVDVGEYRWSLRCRD